MTLSWDSVHDVIYKDELGKEIAWSEVEFQTRRDQGQTYKHTSKGLPIRYWCARYL